MKQFKQLVILAFIGVILALGGLVNAQAEEEAVNTGEDFTRPLTRFDLRQKYHELEAGKMAMFTTFRTDKPFVLGNDWLFSTRFDFPLVYTNAVSSDNPNDNARFGAGDFLFQGLLIAPQGQKTWTWGGGLRAVFPTASQDEMGTGRFNLAPEAGARLDTPFISKGSFVGCLLSNHFDTGGYSNRAHVNYLDIQPAINIALPYDWYIFMAPEMQMNWEVSSHPWFIPFDIMVGKVINKKIVVSVEYETPLLDKNYPIYKQEVELRVGFFF